VDGAAEHALAAVLADVHAWASWSSEV